MKQFKKIGLLLAAFMLGIFSVWAQKPIKTLVVTGQNNHNWPVSHIAIQKILETPVYFKLTWLFLLRKEKICRLLHPTFLPINW